MKKRIVLLSLLLIAAFAVPTQASPVVWNFTTAADYWTNNAVVTALPLPGGGSAYVAPRTVNPLNPDDVLYGADYAAVFAYINTQAYHLSVDDITGGGFTLSGMNHPDAVYGSLYLSPTGAGGSTVMINMSPMGFEGAGGAFVYTFDLNTPADVKIKNGLDGSWGTALTTGTFGGAIDYVNGSAYSGTYAAFFGPQIGMSGTSETTFTVSEIQLNVPDGGTTMTLLGCALIGLGVLRRRFRG